MRFFRRSGLVLTILLVLTVYGLEAHARREISNTPATQGDQAAYLRYAKQMHDTHYAVVGERNRMPVYPFLLSLIYQPNLDEAQFLRRAQSFNINLSIVLLLLLFLIFRKSFPVFYAVALLITTAFGVFVYRAGLAQSELLFYFLNFCAFLFLLRILIAPRWWIALLGGGTLGLAYLTKASVLPLLGLWVAVFVGQGFWEYRSHLKTRLFNPWRHVGLLLLVIGSFTVVIFPYIQTSKRVFGDYFYNVNSTFVMWCDSWPQAKAFVMEYGNKRKRSDFPSDQIPSPAKYWREHSTSQIVSRLSSGLRTLVTRSAKATGYYKFALLFIIASVVLVARRPQLFRQLLGKKPFGVTFCFLFFASYLLLYAWYDAIVSDSRFILSLFLPFLFLASMLVLALGKDGTWTIADRRLSFTQSIALGLIGLSLIDIGYNAIRVSGLVI